MKYTNFLCILEDNYQNVESWECDDVVECHSPDAAWAAENAVEDHAGELGLFGPHSIDITEEAAILVKNCDSGEIVRVQVEAEISVTVNYAQLDKNFTPPKE